VSVPVSVGFSFPFAEVRGAAQRVLHVSRTNASGLCFAALSCRVVLSGLGAINSAVSHRLDHGLNGRQENGEILITLRGNLVHVLVHTCVTNSHI
jgi:hypothetical protein